MTDKYIIYLLSEMKDNCLRADIYNDPKRNDKAEALNYAIFAVEKTGTNRAEWIGLEYDGYADGNPVYTVHECSNCGNIIDSDIVPNFCDNCGADMRR